MGFRPGVIELGKDLAGQFAGCVHDDIDADLARPAGAGGMGGAVPDRWMRVLIGLDHHRRIHVAVIFALVVEDVALKTLDDHLEGFPVHILGLQEGHAVERNFERRDALADAELVAAMG